MIEKVISRVDFKADLPMEFEIVRLSQVYEQHRVGMTHPHRADFYHIIWIKEGSPVHTVDFVPLKLKPNSLLFISKDTVHFFDKKGNFDGNGILFTESFFCRTGDDRKYLKNSILFNSLYDVLPIRLKNNSDAFLLLLTQMEIEFKKPRDSAQEQILKNLLHNFLLLAEREIKVHQKAVNKRGADFELVVRFCELTEEHYKKNKLVSDIAAEMGVTAKKLYNTAIKELGKTPKELIDERVMLESKRLLAHTNSSVKEIGFELGFEETTNFTKFFRKHYGKTPLEFREKYSL